MRILTVVSIGLFCLTPLARAQFQIRFQQGDDVTFIANNGGVNFASPALKTFADGTFSLIYRGGSRVNLLSAIVQGSAAFTLVTAPENEAVLLPEGTANYRVRFLPLTSARATAQMVITFRDADRFPVAVDTLVLNLNGTVPDLSASFFLAADQNFIPAFDGSQIEFPTTLPGARSSATLVIQNRGTGTGEISQVQLTGASFQLSGLPLLPAQLDPGREFRFDVRYAPARQETAAGSLSLRFSGASLTLRLTGSSPSSLIAYEMLEGDVFKPIVPNQSIPFSSVDVGSVSAVSFRVRNTTPADVAITTLAVSGAGFELRDSPPLPLTLAPGGNLSFSVAFTGSTPGRATGRLRINSDSFELVSTATGPKLSYSYGSGSGIAIQPNGTVFFTSARLGASSTLVFTVRNTGTAPGSIGGILVQSASNSYEVLDPPALPASLAANEALQITLRFAPGTLGIVTGILNIDGSTFTLSGSASNPPGVSGYRFEGASGAVGPRQQVEVGLTLAEPYPLALSGTLTMDVSSDSFTTDPAVQFASSGRAVPFSIPANTTQAQFGNSGSRMRLQTGTVAGTITLTPSFSTQANVNVTPETPLRHVLRVPPSAPRLLDAQLTGRNENSFTITVVGYSTTRELKSLAIELQPEVGFNLPEVRHTVNIEAGASLWFEGAQSQPFGGLFSINIPFVLQADPKSAPVAAPVAAVRGAIVSVTGAQGASNSLTVPIQ